MGSFEIWVIVSFAISVTALTVALPSVVTEYLRHQQPHNVRCPLRARNANVFISANLAAWSSAFMAPILHISGCTHWVEERQCGKECIMQILKEVREQSSVME